MEKIKINLFINRNILYPIIQDKCKGFEKSEYLFYKIQTIYKIFE